MTPADFLTLATSCLTACCSEPPMGERATLRERKRRDGELKARRERRRSLGMPDEPDDVAEHQAFGGPLWSVSVPIPAAILPYVFAYAVEGEMQVGGIHGRLESLKGTDDALLVTVTAGAWDRNATVTVPIPYSTDPAQQKLERDLCTGKWVQCPYGKVRVTNLLPKLVPQPYGCDVLIGAEFQRGWFVSGTLDHFKVHPKYARPVLTGFGARLKTLVLPDLTFTNADVAMEVETKQ